MGLLPDDRRPAHKRVPRRRGFCALSLEDWLELAASSGIGNGR